MTKILMIQGAGTNMLGKFAVQMFGTMTLADTNQRIEEYASELGVDVDIFQSNIDGEVVNRLYQAHDGDIDAAVINPSGFSSGYPALVVAIRQVRFPVVEIHHTCQAARGKTSDIAPACAGVVNGFGIFSYYLGLRAALHLATSNEA